MRKLYINFCLAAALSILMSCSDPSSQNLNQSDERALSLVNNFTESFSTSWAEKNAKAMGELYTSDAVRIVSSRQTPLYGRESITVEFESDFKRTQSLTSITADPTVAKFLSSDLVFATGTFSVVDSDDNMISKGFWGNLMKIEGNSLKMLMESAGDATPRGMNNASLAVPEIRDPLYEGSGMNLINEGVASYVLSANNGDSQGIADLFTQNGIQAVSNNDSILFGRESIVDTLNAGTATEIKLDAWSYGYRELGNSLAIGWGGYRQTSPSGELVEFGQWGNIWRITENGLKLIIERASAFSGE